jgi:hypothetical protein
MVAFLKNSGDIILDAVLTDEARARLAKGNKSFNITHFAFGDDEINYEIYNRTHPQGLAYADLNILKTPVLEAITDNASGLKHRLMSIANENLLYLPIIKVNEQGQSVGGAEHQGFKFATGVNGDMFVIICTDTAYNKYIDANVDFPQGFIDGRSHSVASKYAVVLDQGLNNSKDFKAALSADVNETRLLLQIDDRFGKLVEAGTTNVITPNFVDDDDIASYFRTAPAAGASDNFWYPPPSSEKTHSPITGPRGRRFKFSIKASDDMINSATLFNDFGYTKSDFFSDTSGDEASGDAKVIDTLVRISGQKTGISIDIPIRYVREA